MKTFVITVSKNFLSTHPKKGEPTNFKNQILTGKKKHTIRGNYKYWKKIVDLVNKGEAILSVREWEGKPYKSKQVEICKYVKLQIAKVKFKKNKKADADKAHMIIDGRTYTGYMMEVISKNDGFKEVDDFIDWFPKEFKGCIIYFGSVTY